MPAPIGTSVTLAGGDNITLSQSANSVSLIGRGDEPSPDGRMDLGNLDTKGYALQLNEFIWNTQANGSIGLNQTSSMMIPFAIAAPLSFNFIRVPISQSISASTSYATVNANTTLSASWRTTYNFHIYSQGSGANSMTLRSYASTSAGITHLFSQQAGAQASRYSVTLGVSYPMSTNATTNFTATSAASSAAVTVNIASLSNFTGQKALDIPWTTTLAGGHWYLAIGMSTASATNSAAISGVSNAMLTTATFFASTATNAVSFGELGAASNQTIQFPQGLGSFQHGPNGATTASVAFTEISVSSNTPIPLFALHRTA